MTPVRRVAATTIAFAAVGWFGRVGVSHLTGGAADDPPPASALPTYRVVRAALSPAGRDLFARGKKTGEPVFAVLLRHRDCLTCEDIGRQLRELVDVMPTGSTLRVITDSEGEATVRNFLDRERVRAARVQSADITGLFQGHAGVLTPALYIRTGGGADSVRGIEHRRATNVRGSSFAAELHLIGQ